MCSWTLPCASSLVPSILHVSHGFQCSPALNRQPYEGRLPLTSWWRKSSNITVGQSRKISLTHYCYDWHPGSRCGWTCNQLTSKVSSGGQFSDSVWPHNLAMGTRPPSATVVFAEPFSHETGTLRCLQKEMATYRHWSVSLWWDPDDVSHCRILSTDKTEWRFISATLCGWRRCFVADQLWFTTRIREELAGDRMRMLTYLLEFQIPQWWWKWNVIWNLYPGLDHHQKLTSSSDW